LLVVTAAVIVDRSAVRCWYNCLWLKYRCFC